MILVGLQIQLPSFDDSDGWREDALDDPEFFLDDELDDLRERPDIFSDFWNRVTIANTAQQVSFQYESIRTVRY
jgi:hypothetical protein